MITIHNCTKKFRNKTAIDGMTVSFDEGVTGLLGPNGAGKTTLLRCICGLYKLNAGEISTNNSSIGYLPQKFGMLKGLTLYQMMDYFATLKGISKDKIKEEIEFSIEQVNLSDRLSSKVSELSGGMVRRAGIAQAIMGNPQIILLDEPTAGLDPEERVRLKNAIIRISAGKTILLSTHIVSDVEAICDQVVIMDHGRLNAKGSTGEIAAYAEGKVFEVSEKDEDNLRGDYFIKDREERNGGRTLRVLSSMEQPGTRLSPTMEDGYLCSIKNI